MTLSDSITKPQKLMLDMHFIGHMRVFHAIVANFEVLKMVLKELNDNHVLNGREVDP